MSQQQRRQIEELRRDLAGLRSPDSGACGPEDDPPVRIQVIFDRDAYGDRPAGMAHLPRFSEDYGGGNGPFFFEMPLALYRAKLAAGYRFDDVYRDADGQSVAKL